MNINPFTLEEETAGEKEDRQRVTGVMGNGLTVICHPTGDPDVFQIQSRAVCLTRPYEACQTCPHRAFTLVFNANREDRFRLVACPRWESTQARLESRAPVAYAPMEVAGCDERPFDFCSSCPSREDLSKLGVDKAKPGWYGRWARLKVLED